MANQGYGNFENAALPEGGKTPPDKQASEHQVKDEGDGDKVDMPAAGPHADPALTNHDATPGAGAMPEGPAPGNDPDPGTG